MANCAKGPDDRDLDHDHASEEEGPAEEEGAAEEGQA